MITHTEKLFEYGRHSQIHRKRYNQLLFGACIHQNETVKVDNHINVNFVRGSKHKWTEG